MDHIFCRTSSGSPSSPPSLFSVDGIRAPMLDFVSCEIPEQWLGDDDGSRSAGNDDQSGEPPAPAAKTRGRRKPGSMTYGHSHEEAERQRREKLNRRFCDLRAVVPTVSRMHRASLLADAAAYIGELRGRVDKLEADAKQQAADAAAASAAVASPWLGLERKLEVRMVGRDAAALRLTSAPEQQGLVPKCD